jgi:hypothetical protein
MSEPVDPLTVKNELISRLLHPGKGSLFTVRLPGAVKR